MNTIQGIIHDLGNEETFIGGCTTPGEVIITLQGLVEENNLLKNKLGKIKQVREEIEDRIDNYPDRNISEYEDCLAILDKLILESEDK